MHVVTMTLPSEDRGANRPQRWSGKRKIDWLIDYCFLSRWGIFHSYRNVSIVSSQWRAAKFKSMLDLATSKIRGIFIVSYTSLPWHGTSVCKVSFNGLCHLVASYNKPASGSSKKISGDLVTHILRLIAKPVTLASFNLLSVVSRHTHVCSESKLFGTLCRHKASERA